MGYNHWLKPKRLFSQIGQMEKWCSLSLHWMHHFSQHSTHYITCSHVREQCEASVLYFQTFLVMRCTYWVWLEHWNLIGLERLDPSHLINYMWQDVCEMSLKVYWTTKTLSLFGPNFSCQNPPFNFRYRFHTGELFCQICRIWNVSFDSC